MPKVLLAGGALCVAAAIALFLFIGFGAHVPPVADMRALPRAGNGETYVLFIRVPPTCTRRAPCPALYVLDGANWMGPFEHIVDVETRAGRARPVVLVGIGYQDFVATGRLRKRDFTPNFAHEDAAVGATGGAAAFLRVLQGEIIPYVEARYPVDRRERGLAAHSYAGLFAAYALDRAPGLFDRYLIVSPALWFDNYRIFTQHTPPHPGVRIALASDTPTSDESAMARDVRRFSAALQHDTHVTPLVRIYAGTTHMSVPPIAFRDAFPALYPPITSARAAPGENR